MLVLANDFGHVVERKDDFIHFVDKAVLAEDVGLGHFGVVHIDIVLLACAGGLVVEEVDVAAEQLVGGDELRIEVEHGWCCGGIGEEHDVLVVGTHVVEAVIVGQNALRVGRGNHQHGVEETGGGGTAEHLATDGGGHTCRRGNHGGGERVIDHGGVEQQFLLRQGEFVITAHTPVVGTEEALEGIVVGDEQCFTTGLGEDVGQPQIVNQFQVCGVVSLLLDIAIDAVQP